LHRTSGWISVQFVPAMNTRKRKAITASITHRKERKYQLALHVMKAPRLKPNDVNPVGNPVVIEKKSPREHCLIRF